MGGGVGGGGWGATFITNNPLQPLIRTSGSVSCTPVRASACFGLALPYLAILPFKHQATQAFKCVLGVRKTNNDKPRTLFSSLCIHTSMQSNPILYSVLIGTLGCNLGSMNSSPQVGFVSANGRCKLRIAFVDTRSPRTWLFGLFPKR